MIGKNSDPCRPNEVGRRSLLKFLGVFGAYAATSQFISNVTGASQDLKKILLPFERGERELATFPQKRPMILLTSRPPQLETPFSIFNEGVITPNDAFFVRYHWSAIPTFIDLKTYRLKIGGKVKTPLELSIEDLKKIADPIDLIAVNQCSGNGRGHFLPRVNGGQLSNGAMGNAKWTGVSLKAVLTKAGLQPGAVQVSFNGLDQPPLESGPDFVKALNIDHALDGEVMLAWAMNGKDLPMLNGYPLRVIVPGYYGTYWIKHLTDIQVLDRVFDGFWMNTAYRIPDNTCACIEPGSATDRLIPINRLNVRSFITNINGGARLPLGRETQVRGIAFDGGHGVNEVAFSSDGGLSWKQTHLGKDFGRYSFREWSTSFKSLKKGTHKLQVRAINRIGQGQPADALWNPAGYMRNVVETVNVTVV